MDKTKHKPPTFPRFDKLGQRIVHAVRALGKRRKERAQRAFERSLAPLLD